MKCFEYRLWQPAGARLLWPLSDPARGCSDRLRPHTEQFRMGVERQHRECIVDPVLDRRELLAFEWTVDSLTEEVPSASCSLVEDLAVLEFELHSLAVKFRREDAHRSDRPRVSDGSCVHRRERRWFEEDNVTMVLDLVLGHLASA